MQAKNKDNKSTNTPVETSTNSSSAPPGDRRSFKLSKWQVITAVTLLGLALLVKFGVPLAAKWAVENYSSRYTPWTITIEQIDYEVLESDLHLSGIQFWQDSKVILSLQQLEAGIDGSSLLTGDLTIDLFDLSGLELSVKQEDDQLQIAGSNFGSKKKDAALPETENEVNTEQPTSQQPEGLGLSTGPLYLRDVTIHLSGSEEHIHQLKISEADIGPLDLRTEPYRLPIALKLTLDGAPIEITGHLQLPTGASKIAIKATPLPLTNISQILSILGIEAPSFQGSVQVDLNTDLTLSKNQRIVSTSGSLNELDVTVSLSEDQKLVISSDTFTLNATHQQNLSGEESTASQTTTLNSDTSLDIDIQKLKASYTTQSTNQAIHLAFNQLSNQSRLQQSSEGYDIEMNQPIIIQGMSLTQEQGADSRSYRSDKLEATLSRFKSEPSFTNFEAQLALANQNATFIVDPKTILQWRDLNLQANYSQNELRNLTLSEFSLAEFALLQGSDDSRQAVLKISQLGAGQVEFKQNQATPNTAVLLERLNVKQLQLADPEPSKLSASEKSIDILIRDLNFERNPVAKGQESKLSLGYGAYGNIQARILEHSNGSQVVSGNLHSINLTDFSGLLRQQIGYQVNQGQLDGKLGYQVDQSGMLNGKLDLEIRRIAIGNETARGNPIENRLGMPLSSLLSLATNDDGDLNLSFPISGNVDSPEFQWSILVSKKLGSLLLDQLSSSLGAAAFTSLLPLVASSMPVNPAMAYTLIKKGWKLAENLQLEPIEFSRETNQPSEEGHKQLKTLAKNLKSNEKIVFTFCTDAQVLTPGEAASESSQTKDRDQALARAKERLTQVADFLIEENGVNAKQIILCEPKLDEAKTYTTPQVTLQI